MDTNLEFSLDKSIEKLLTKEFEYSVEKIIQEYFSIQKLLKAISDRNDYEFYEGIIDEIFIEMFDKLENDEINQSGSLKEKFDDIGNFLYQDIRRSFSKKLETKSVKSSVKFTSELQNDSNIRTLKESYVFGDVDSKKILLNFSKNNSSFGKSGRKWSTTNFSLRHRNNVIKKRK